MYVYSRGIYMTYVSIQYRAVHADFKHCGEGYVIGSVLSFICVIGVQDNFKSCEQEDQVLGSTGLFLGTRRRNRSCMRG